jgi:predicted hotdog family 3-hydroxylacyl-ACP dehydratase
MTIEQKKLDDADLSAWVDKVSIEELIPHSPPMVLLDRVVSVAVDRLTAELILTSDSKFFNKSLHAVPSWVGIEYMAQAIAALAGLRAKSIGEPIKLGFLLGTRKYHMAEKTLPNNQAIQVLVEQLYYDDSGLASFDCQIVSDDKLLASAKLNVFETNDLQSILGR